MNHQVEDDVDVEAALRKGAEAMDLDEARIGQQRPRGIDRRVEALGLTDRKRNAGPCRGRDHRIGFRQGARQRLLHEHGDAGVEKRQRDRGMLFGWDRDGHGIDRPKQLACVEARLRVIRGRKLDGARVIRVDDRDELDAGQRRQNPGVVAAKMTDADDADAQAHVRTSASAR